MCSEDFCTEYSEYLVLYHGFRAVWGILWESKRSWLKAAEFAELLTQGDHSQLV